MVFFYFSFGFQIGLRRYFVCLRNFFALRVEQLRHNHFLGETEVDFHAAATFDRVVLRVGLVLGGKAFKPLGELQIVQITNLHQTVDLIK